MWLQYLYFLIIFIYLGIGFLIVEPAVKVMVRKIRITLKYRKISFSLFFLGLKEGFVIAFIFFWWFGVILGTLIFNIPKIWSKKK